jgi:hypothetical protein
MGLIKNIGRAFTIITLLVVLLGVKIYFDVMDDKEDFEKLIQQSPEMTQEEYEERLQICEEKGYFDPFCKTMTISYKYENEGSFSDADCDTIEYGGVPYYLWPFEGKIKSYFENLRSSCIGGTEIVEDFILE